MEKGGRTMRKRRVLAVWLALSLVLSGNGVTVLAAETGVDQPGVTTQIETPETNENTEEGGPAEEAQEPEESQTSGETQESGESQTPGETQEPGENETPAEPEDGETPGTAEEPGENVAPEETETPEDTEKPDAADEEETKDPVEEQPEEEEEPAQEQEEPGQAASEVQSYVSRIVTFTDDTGMKVTYDANASTQYRYVVENGVLKNVLKQSTTVSGNTIEEPMVFEGNVELKQPEEGDKYTSIAASVFGGNQSITYVKLPAGVESIGAEAFKGCTALKGVYLPASVNTIENSAFENCTSLTQINIPKAVTTIGDAAFKGDARLYLVFMKEVDYSELRSIGAEAFSGCAVLSQLCSHSDFVFPTRLETIGEAAFRDCKAIGKVDFTANKNLISIGKYAFAGCTGMTDLTPGDTLSMIPEGAFEGCNNLVNINFVHGKPMTIGRGAFRRCYGLKQLELPQTVTKIEAEAFQGCTKLKQIAIQCYMISIEANAFPADAVDLVIVADKGSNGYKYALENNFKILDENVFYQYTVEDVNGVLMPKDKDSKGKDIEGKYIFPGGTIWVGTETQNRAEENVNTLNKGKGVKSGEPCYIYYSQTDTQKNSFTFITESLRCNGKTMQKKEGKYFFEMPAGGAVITAEFRANTPDVIDGQKVTVEFSNGTPLQNGLMDEYGYRGVELKEGQTCRMFLLDENGKPIPAAKLAAVSSGDKKVATVDKNGVITAAGTKGADKASTTITVTVKGGDGREITISRSVSVILADAKSIILKATDYDKTFVKIEGNADGIQTASIHKTIASKPDTDIRTFKLKANVYDSEEPINKELTWTTSNTKVATLKSDKTTAANPVNEVYIKQGCEGEATITVTAKNPASSEKEKITQKFVVRVYEEGFRLANSKLTLNPRLEEGAIVELISAYGIGLQDAYITLYAESGQATSQFTAAYIAGKSSETCRRFCIKPDTETINNGTYRVGVGVNGDKSNLIPLTITVKESKPNPTVKFNTNKVKFNLFYKNGGTNAKGETISVVTEITKLGTAKVREVKLEPLTQKEDDKFFTENFVIDDENTNLAKGKVVIKRSEGALKYRKSDKKAALTGYLTLYFDGYDDGAAKRVKVTMPNCTTAPSWALRTTKGNYYEDVDEAQEIRLELYDKKSKKKETVVLGEDYTVTEENRTIVTEGDPEIKNGAIVVKFWPTLDDESSGQMKMKLVLGNPAWDKDKNGKDRTLTYTYTVNVKNDKPTVKTDQGTVTLNLNYPEKEAKFKLVSSLSGLKIEPTQAFVPKKTDKNAAEIEKLQVIYENGEGTVAIKSGQTIKKGTYQFECEPQTARSGLKKTTLKVKVVDSKPTIKFGKGNLQLNKIVYANNSTANGDVPDPSELVPDYRETAEVTFKESGMPEGYTLAPVGTDGQDTEIVCTTKNKEGAERSFTFNVEVRPKKENPEQEKENVLSVSLNDRNLGTGTYSFKMTARYRKAGVTTVSAKPVTFKVKVISKDDIYLDVAAKGKVNLLNREGEANDKNGIVYAPALKNIVGEIEEVKIYDTTSRTEESKFFDISLITEGKNAGKFFVTPKKTAVGHNADGSITYSYAELEHNKSYSVRIWVKVKGYAGEANTNGGVLTKNIRIKTAQILPAVTTDKKNLDVYLSTKDYDAAFVVKAKSGSVGTVEEVYFDEKDELANESFELIQTPQADGSMKVIVHLKEAVGFANGTTNNVKFYVKYKGQGTKTSKKATGFTMKIKVN